MPNPKHADSLVRDLLRYYLLPLGCVLGMISGHPRFLSAEVARIACHLVLGLWISHFICAALLPRVRKEPTGCTTFLQVAAAVYAAQVILYLSFRPFHPALIAPIGIPVFWALLWGAAAIRQRVKPRGCAVCSRPARFSLESGRPDRPTERVYCYDHMMERLRTVTETHAGRFVVVAPPKAPESKSAQYRYYAPQDMALDSYPESDIEATRRVIEAAFRNVPGGVRAVRIPREEVKDIGSFTDTPLFVVPPHQLDASPLTDSELIALLRSALSSFDRDGYRFGMNEPCSDTGIYLWHDYL